MDNLFIYIYYILYTPFIEKKKYKGTRKFALCGREEERNGVETMDFHQW